MSYTDSTAQSYTCAESVTQPIYQYNPSISQFKVNVIQQDIFEDPSYIAFRRDNLDIFDRLKNILKQNFSGYTLDYISQELDANPIHINQMLSLWNQHYCTFFDMYGRIIFNPKNEHWVFIPNRHPQVRQTNITFEELQFYNMD